MESSTTTNQESKSKADSLLQQFYSKTAQIIVRSRLSLEPNNSKRNKWFNIELEDYEPLREEMKFWKGQLVATAQAPPLFVDILLDISHLTIAQHLILTNNSTGRKHRIRPEDLMGVDPTGRPIRKRNILLETWQLTFRPEIGEQIPELPLVYKKCIIFFRSLYSFLRLMPSFKLCKRIGKMDSTCKIIYRVGSSRTNSPYDAGLDQLHSSNDMRLGLSESDFENLETPLGVFHLHVTYRLDCDFDIDDSESALDRFTDLEPHFFHVEEISKRRSSLASLQVSERDSITRLGRHSPSTDFGKSRMGSIPKSREGVSIPNRSRWKDTSFGKNSLSSVSPDTQFRIGTAPSRGYQYDQRSLNSPNFVPFTPPTSDPVIPFNNDWLFRFPTELPPFSTPATESESTKFIVNKPEFISESPPFALSKPDSEDLNRSLSIVRRPSYIFPTNSPTQIGATPPHPPLLFTPSSSFRQASLRSRTSPPPLLLRQNYESSHNSPDVEHFLSSIDQARALKITSGTEKVQQSILDGSKGESSVQIENALSKFRILQKDNSAFTKKVDFMISKDDPPSEPPKGAPKQPSSTGLILEKPFHSVWSPNVGETTPVNPKPVSNSWTTRDTRVETFDWREGNKAPFNWNAQSNKPSDIEPFQYGPEQKPFDYPQEEKPFEYPEQKPYNWENKEKPFDWEKKEEYKWNQTEQNFEWNQKKNSDWEKNDSTLSATRTKSKRGRQRSVTSDWQQREPVQLENLSRSESFRDSKYDEDELVFNMSELDL